MYCIVTMVLFVVILIKFYVCMYTNTSSYRVRCQPSLFGQLPLPMVNCSNSCLSQITMTTDWLLLFLVVVCSQSVDSQPTTDDETCSEGALLSNLHSDIERIMLNQQQQYRMVMNRFGESQRISPTISTLSSLSIECIHSTRAHQTFKVIEGHLDWCCCQITYSFLVTFHCNYALS